MSFQELQPILSFASNFSKQLMKSLSQSLRFGFFQFLLFSADLTSLLTLCRSLISGPLKGGLQLDISQAKIPIVQKSISFPQPCRRTISGAQQMVVPASVLDSSSSLNSLARPKSVSFTYPFSKMRIFSGFKSLYMIKLECRYSMPSMRQAKMNLTAGSPIFLKSSNLFESLLMREQVSPPCAHSMTKYRYLASLKAQCKVVINLHFDSCNIFFYSLMLDVSFLSKICDFKMRLIAYFSSMPFALFSMSSPRKTSPKPPEPMRWVTLKSSHLIVFLSLGSGYFSSICLIIYSSFSGFGLVSLVGTMICGGRLASTYFDFYFFYSWAVLSVLCFYPLGRGQLRVFGSLSFQQHMFPIPFEIVYKHRNLVINIMRFLPESRPIKC